ncbi:MAG: hypothetical protein AB7P17_06830 [Nitrospirales bacterium]|nr:hypothetical protein [Nitrospirales bacterium]
MARLPFTPQLSSLPTSGTYPDAAPVLLASGLADTDVSRILQAYGMNDWKLADRNLQEMAGDPASRKALAVIVNALLAGAAVSADPAQALNEWERFVNSGLHRLQLYHYLAMLPHVVRVLSTVFGNSPAMAQTLQRDPLLVYWIEDDRVLIRAQTRQSLTEQCQNSLAAVKTLEAKSEALRRFKRREMLRIGIRDFLGEAQVEETYTSLSELTAVVIQAAYELVQQDLMRRHGVPRRRASNAQTGTGFCVLGMGKLGGWELNYSSDIDLVYVYQAPSGMTQTKEGQTSISHEEYFSSLGQELTSLLSTSTAEGAMFRVDLRLRPEGSVGALACSVEDALHYYQVRGRTWERLAFLKALPLAGNRRVGQLLMRRLRPFVLGNPETAGNIIGSIRDLRGQIRTKITRRGEWDRHVKLGTGGIREIEFIVQGLQLRWGHAHPRIMDRQTLKGLAKLVRVGILDKHDAETLRESYRYLRNLEHKIQMVHELQTHVLPTHPDELAKCAIRMGAPQGRTSEEITQNFLAEYRYHTMRVHTLYERIIG